MILFAIIYAIILILAFFVGWYIAKKTWKE